MQHSFTPNSKRILLMGARAPVTLALARTLAGQGHSVFVADSFWPHICQTSRAVSRSLELPPPRFQPQKFMDRLEQIVLLERIDLVIPTCEEVMYLAQGAEHSPLREHFWVDSFSTLEGLHHKGKFIALCQNIGLQVPETHVLEGKAALEGFCRSVTGKWVFKPAYSRFATQTVFWNRGERVPQNLTFPLVAQRFLEGREFCSYSLAQQGQVLAQVAYQPKYRAGKGAGVYLEQIYHAQAQEFAQTLASSLKFTGQFALDFIETPQGIFPLECNPRAVSGAALLDGFTLNQALFPPDFPHGFDMPNSRKPHPPRAFQKFPQVVGTPQKNETARVMFALPTVFAGLGKVPLKTLISDLAQAKDLIWDAADPAPFFQQIPCIWATLQRAQKLKISPLEATTWDIEWDGKA
jgi:predicted ATP-grasp superfamily ATP-dependent carboligase